MKKSVLILLSAIVVTLVSSNGYGQELSKDEEGLYTTPEQSLTAQMNQGQTLTVTIPVMIKGNLSVVTEDISEVSLRFRKRAFTDNKRSAFDYIDVVTVSLTKSGGGARLECRAPSSPDWGDNGYVSVELELTIPKDAILRVDAPKVHTIVEGPLKGIAVMGVEAGVEILDVVEWTSISANQSSVKLERISGKINVQMTGGTLVIEEVTALNEAVQLESDGADVRINAFKGGLDLNAESGRIEITEFEPVGDKSSLRVNAAPMQVEISRMDSGRINLANKGDDIELTVPGDIQAKFSLTVDEGSTISATRLQMKPDLVLPQRLNIVTGNGAAEIRASVRRSGNIYLRGYGEND